MSQWQPPASVEGDLEARNEEVLHRASLVPARIPGNGDGDPCDSQRSSVLPPGDGMGGFEAKPEDSGRIVPQFAQEDKRFFVFSTCHTGVPPRVTRPEDAGVRLYGGFESNEAALDYATELADKDPDCAVQISTAHTWIICCSTLARISDPVYSAQKLNALLDIHTDDRAAASAQFESYVKDPDAFRAAAAADADAADTDAADEFASAPARAPAVDTESDKQPQVDCARYTKRFNRGMELRCQNFAVVSILADPTPQGEFGLCVWGFFDSEADCDIYVRAAAGEHVRDHAMHVVSLYDWILPRHMQDDSAIPTHYRSTELDKMMKHARGQKRSVESFKQWCSEDGKGVPRIEV